MRQPLTRADMAVPRLCPEGLRSVIYLGLLFMTCPFCAEDAHDSAIICKHCGRDIPVLKPDDVRDELTLVHKVIGLVVIGVTVFLLALF